MANNVNIADENGLPGHMTILQLNPENSNKVEDRYTVLVNPSSYSINYNACYHKDQPIGATQTNLRFNKAEAQVMSLSLLFDSTGSLGNIEQIANKSVLTQIEEFLKIAYANQQEYTESRKMKLIWGPMQFVGVLVSIKITYSHFDVTGEPIRAKAECKFTGGNVSFEDNSDGLVGGAKKSPKKIVDFSTEKHAINQLQSYGGYLAILARQPEGALPKTLRKASELAKLIIE